jgi:hypothetical protein
MAWTIVGQRQHNLPRRPTTFDRSIATEGSAIWYLVRIQRITHASHLVNSTNLRESFGIARINVLWAIKIVSQMESAFQEL